MTDCPHAVPAAEPAAHDQPSPEPVYVAFAGTGSDNTVEPDADPLFVTVIPYTNTSPALITVDGVAGEPFTVNNDITVSNTTVGLDGGVQPEHVPTLEVTTSPTDVVPAGNGDTTVIV